MYYYPTGENGIENYLKFTQINLINYKEGVSILCKKKIMPKKWTQ